MQTVLFCIPGTNFSKRFINRWTKLLKACSSYDVAPILANGFDPNFYNSYNVSLGGEGFLKASARPFQGKIAYDYLMFIGQNQLFEPEDFQRLLAHQMDAISGVYLREEGSYSCEIAPNQFLTKKQLATKEKPFPVYSNGLGFLLLKRAGLEALDYPWFRPVKEGSQILEHEDSFFYRLREKGFPLFVDPKVITHIERKQPVFPSC